jgi:hypothetical protein
VSLTLEEGDQITSSIDLCQDETNKRHYNISIEILGEGEDEDDSDSEEDDSNHPIPCDCGATRCILVQALVEKYDAEQTELEKEAEKVDVSAEVEAAKVIDREMAENTTCCTTVTRDRVIRVILLRIRVILILPFTENFN